MNAGTVLALIEIIFEVAEKLIDRSKQQGLFTDEQVKQLEDRAALLFQRFGAAPPPPD